MKGEAPLREAERAAPLQIIPAARLSEPSSSPRSTPNSLAESIAVAAAAGGFDHGASVPDRKERHKDCDRQDRKE